jgi:hypothetical protein
LAPRHERGRHESPAAARLNDRSWHNWLTGAPVKQLLIAYDHI